MKRLSFSFAHGLLLIGLASATVWAAHGCSASTESRSFTGTGGDGGDGVTGPASSAATLASGNGGGFNFDAGNSDGSGCGATCSSDMHQVLDCNGMVVQTCTGLEGCDASTGTCTNACAAAVNNKQSVGCEYYATFMDTLNSDACFAVFVANTWNTPAHLTVEHTGAPVSLASFAKIPSGSGPSLTYADFDPAMGLAPGQVAILFLSGPTGIPGIGFPVCPVPSAVPSGVLMYGATGVGNSFRIASDVPVVAYEINPFGGGSAAITAASLLLPTSAWDTNYIAVNVTPYDIAPPSMNIVAAEDNTSVTMVPVNAVQGGGGVPPSPANTPMTFTLHKGQHAQFTQQADLTGSVIQSDKPVGFMAGQQCMRIPLGVAYCDHGEQMIPPIRALGSEYVGVMYRPRTSEPAIWRLIGAIDGTTLTWSSPVGGPPTLNAGQSVEFTTAEPFVVKSQDKDHPFMLFTYMSGSTWQLNQDGYGDPDFVISVPPQQYMPAYVFFADPTYPETNLVVVRAKDNGQFHDVNLDCAGNLTGWQAVGDYEWTRIDLITGNFQPVGGCSTGRHEIRSQGRFGLWVWGWGTPQTVEFTENVSYGYPGGMNVQAINTVIIPPTPK